MITFVVKDTLMSKTYGVFSDRIKAEQFIDFLKYDKGLDAEWVVHWIDFNLGDMGR